MRESHRMKNILQSKNCENNMLIDLEKKHLKKLLKKKKKKRKKLRRL
jgi:hypothetical protein